MGYDVVSSTNVMVNGWRRIMPVTGFILSVYATGEYR
jgi:hypothetical protein